MMKVSELEILDKDLEVVGYECEGEQWELTRVVTRNDWHFSQKGDLMFIKVI